MFVQFNPKAIRCIYSTTNRINPKTSIPETISTFTTKAGIKGKELISHYGDNADYAQTVLSDKNDIPQMVIHKAVDGEIRRFMRASEFGKKAQELEQIPYRSHGQNFFLISDNVFNSFCAIG